MLRILSRLTPFSGHARVPAASKRRGQRFLQPTVEGLESRLLLTGPELDVSHDIWDVFHEYGSDNTASYISKKI